MGKGKLMEKVMEKGKGEAKGEGKGNALQGPEMNQLMEASYIFQS